MFFNYEYLELKALSDYFGKAQTFKIQSSVENGKIYCSYEIKKSKSFYLYEKF